MKQNSTTKNLLPLLLAVLGMASSASASTKTFVIDNQKLAYRNVASVESVGEYESFTGRTNGVSGSIDFDPEKKTGRGTITVDVASLDTGIPLRNEHLRSEAWLDAAKYPKITFEALKVKKTGVDSYKVTGNFSLHGVTKVITVKVRVRYKAAGTATQAAGFSGDVIQLNTSFPITLADYGVQIPAMAKGKVAEDVTLTLSTYAVAQ